MRPQLLDNPRHADRFEYLCLVCSYHFLFHSGDIVCPRCKNADHEEVVPLYVEDDPRNDQFISSLDYGEGD